MESEERRPSSWPQFWDERFHAYDALFGTQPSGFIGDEAYRIPPESRVLELGAGEGRTLVWLCLEHGHQVTALDFSEVALQQAEAWAEKYDLRLDTIKADVRTWEPSRSWDAVIVTFVQLLPGERPKLYRRMRGATRPGGWIFGEWFRPAHVASDRYDRIGPSRMDRMVPVREVRSAFSDDDIARCDAEDVYLEGGEFLNGHAGVVRLVAQRGTQ